MHADTHEHTIRGILEVQKDKNIYKASQKHETYTHRLKIAHWIKPTLTNWWGSIHLKPLSKPTGQNLTAHQGESWQAGVPYNIPCEVIYTRNQTHTQTQASSGHEKHIHPFIHPPNHEHRHTHKHTHRARLVKASSELALEKVISNTFSNEDRHPLS